MDVELTEAPAQRLVLVRRERLVAEEEDAMLGERLVDLRSARLLERRGQIDPEDLRAAPGGDPSHLDGLRAHDTPP
jgi:hypothetical protein